MPAQDKTGPTGQGALTGRGLGRCNKSGAIPVWCGGKSFGRGRGFGWRASANQPVELTKEQERQILKAELVEIEAEKKEIEKALNKIK